jgi:hypothetical protein
MFRQARPNALQDLISTEQILAICPWLWAWEQIWAKGFCSHSGSVHVLTVEVLQQEFDRFDEGETGIFLFGERQGVMWTRQAPRDGPMAQGKTVAERVVTALWPNVRDETILQLVIRTPGEVDRTDEYYIYQAAESLHLGLPAHSNLLSTILEAANGFKPVFP